jgi:hypothetical protein
LEDRRATDGSQHIRANRERRCVAEKRDGEIRAAEGTVAVQCDDFAAAQGGHDWNAAQGMFVGGEEVEFFFPQSEVEEGADAGFFFFEHDQIDGLAKFAEHVSTHFPGTEVCAHKDDAFALVEALAEHVFSFEAALHLRPSHDDGDPVQEHDAEREEMAINQERPFPEGLGAKNTPEELD